MNSSDTVISVMPVDNSSFSDVAYDPATGMKANGTNVSDSFLDQEKAFEHAPMYLFVCVTVFNIIVFLGGIFGNTMVILVICKVRAMRNATNFFLFSLSVADLLVLLICQPVAMMEFYSMDRWYLGKAMCKIVPLMENGMWHVSILTIVAVTTERFFAICYPFKAQANCSESMAVKVLVVLWVTAYVCTLPFLVMTEMDSDIFYDGTEINVCRTRVHQTWHRVYMVGLFTFFFALPFLVLIFMYAKIIKQLMSDNLRILTSADSCAKYTHRARKQVVRMLIFIIILFFVSLGPMRVVALWQIFTPVQEIEKLGLEGYLSLISFARLLMYINSAGNPIIYSLTSTKFKLAFKRVLRRTDPWQRNDYRTTSQATSYMWFRRSKKKRCEIQLNQGVNIGRLAANHCGGNVNQGGNGGNVIQPGNGGSRNQLECELRGNGTETRTTTMLKADV